MKIRFLKPLLAVVLTMMCLQVWADRPKLPTHIIIIRDVILPMPPAPRSGGNAVTCVADFEERWIEVTFNTDLGWVNVEVIAPDGLVWDSMFIDSSSMSAVTLRLPAIRNGERGVLHIAGPNYSGYGEIIQ